MKGLFTLLVFLALVVGMVLLGTVMQPSYPTSGAARPQFRFGGSEMSLEAAQSVVSFPIAVPSYLPRALGYTSVRVDLSASPEGPVVYLIYSPFPVTSNMTADDLLASGGFFIVESPEPNVDLAAVIDAQVRYNGATRITVDGNPGCYAGDQVNWWAIGIHYDIVSPYPESDMLAIATSMGT